jgi:hypothetical protein
MGETGPILAMERTSSGRGYVQFSMSLSIRSRLGSTRLATLQEERNRKLNTPKADNINELFVEALSKFHRHGVGRG